MSSQYLQIAEQLFAQHKQPLSARELIDRAIEQRLLSDRFSGATPHQTMKARLSTDIRQKGSASIFVRTNPGQFFLRRLLNEGDKPYEAPPATPANANEQVAIFPATWLDHQGRFQGVAHNWKNFYKSLFKTAPITYKDRLAAERDNHHKQILSYIMVTRKGQILLYKRGKFNRVEDFLRGSECIGFGGHLSADDLDLLNREDFGLFDSAVRELNEEVVLPLEDQKRLARREGLNIVGVLNDDSSPAGRRHLAFIFQYEVSDHPDWNHPQRGERSINQLRWVTPDSAIFWDLEYWSQLCLREFFRNSVKTQPTYRIRRKAPLRPPHLLCVLGGIGSGKSEATKILVSEFGYEEINSGRIVAELIGLPPVPTTSREAFQAEALKFIKKPGSPQRLARELLKRAQCNSSPRVLIDGIRQKATLESLKLLAKGLSIGVLFVHTPPDIAYEFYKVRDRPDISIQDFLRLRDSPVEQEVASLIKHADAVLYNWTGRLLYQKAIRSLLREVRQKSKNSVDVPRVRQ